MECNIQALSEKACYCTTHSHIHKSFQKCDKLHMQIKLFATYLLLNCLYLIKICVCSHITTMQTFVIDYEIKVMYFELYIKLYISSKLYINRLYMKIKKFFFFSYQSSLQAFNLYICIYKEQKGHPVEKKEINAQTLFFSKQTCLKNE